ncbi:cell division protein ZapA [Sulfuriferula plumbiphila]|uniref:Cell division protein ZapA n=1 Tax=Sulfuriferula plumbiphila TaxID=171865 RepID=A0A512L584_9PROT|nr:cell division protein ZapA [Sulfuriferula plumbiphila]BBP05877.1 cell division protein ZapA [Sulfuriferula plumbiphila]GEP29647.1 cell division protein ZapA [Sulfuriferula plumbiphila]
MSRDSKGMDINILGREFRVACPAHEQDALLSAAAYLDKKMREIREQGKVIGVERIAVMAALNIAYELLSAREDTGFDITAIKRRMSSMEALLDEAMAEQNELFSSSEPS